MVRGSALNLFDQGLRFVAVFVMTPIIVLTLGEEKYGFWALLMSIVGHYGLLDFGLSMSISRFFAKSVGKGDAGELSRYISAALQIFFRIGGLGLVITGVAFVLAPYFLTDPEQLYFARYIIILYGLVICLGFPIRVFRSFLKSQLRYDMVVLGSTVQVVCGNLALFIYFKGGYGNELYALAAINLAAMLLEHLVVFVFGLKGMRQLGVRRVSADRQTRRELLGYSGVSFVSAIGQSLRFRLDPVIIGWGVGVASVTYYKIGLLFPFYFRDIVGAILGGQMLAMFSHLYGRGDTETLNSSFLTATKASAVIATWCGTAMIFFGEDFILRWMKEPAFLESYHVLVILVVPFIFFLMQFPSLSLLQALGKHRYIMWMVLSAGVGNVILSVIFVQWLGMLGVVWASAVEMTFVYLVVFPIIVSRVAGISWVSLYRDSFVIPVLKSLAILAPFYFLLKGYLEPDFGRLALIGAAQLVYFVPLAFFLIPTRKERALIMRMLKRGGSE